LLLSIIGSVLTTKLSSIKTDASEIKFIPITSGNTNVPSRITRQSAALYTPANNIKYQYHFVPASETANGDVRSEQEDSLGNDIQYVTPQLQEYYQSLPQKQQQIVASKQPKFPVYHATPLEPFGALLKHEEKAVLVTPKPPAEQHQEAGGHSSDAVGKYTQVVIPEPKYAPVIYKTLQSHHQYDENVESKNVSHRIQYLFPP